MTQQLNIKAAAARVLARHAATEAATTPATSVKNPVAHDPLLQQRAGDQSVVVTFDPERARRAVERIEAERERRRQDVLALLAATPEIGHAWLTDDKGDADYVILAVAIRDVGTAELTIARDRYDGFKLLRLLEQGPVS